MKTNTGHRAILAVLPLLAACTEPVKSTDITTDQMTATLAASCNGEDTTVSAFLTVGEELPITYVTLDPATDSMTATAGDVTEEMEELQVEELISYLAFFYYAESEGLVTISFYRDIDEGAPASTTNLPPNFDVSSPIEGSSFSRTTEDLLLGWVGDTAGDAMDLRVTGDCIETYDAPVEDNGGLTLAAGTLISAAGAEANTCDITIQLQRSREGTVDPGFMSGEFPAYQTRSVTVSAAP